MNVLSPNENLAGARNRSRLAAKDWPLALAFIAILVTGFMLRAYDLGERNFHEDEFQTIETAAGYLFTGAFETWDFVREAPSGRKYPRAFPFTWQVSQSFRLFEISELTARLPSLFWGTSLCVFAFFFSRYMFESKLLAIAAMLLIALNPECVKLSRYARMYAFFSPLFLVAIYLVYRGLESPAERSRGWLARYGIDRKYLILGIAALCLSALVHQFTLILVFPLFAYFVLRFADSAGQRGWRSAAAEKYGIGLGLMITGALVLLVLRYGLGVERILGFHTLPTDAITVLAPPHYEYVSYLLDGFFPMAIALLLFTIGAAACLGDRKREYCLLIVLGLTAFLVFFADRYLARRYIAHVIPIAIPIVLLGFFSLGSWLSNLAPGLWSKRIVLGVMLSLVLALSAMSLQYHVDRLAREHRRVNFANAYVEINESFVDGEVVLAQFPRRYYLLPGTKIVSMQRDAQFTFDQFIRVVYAHGSGWVTWESGKSRHLASPIRRFVRQNFTQLHGHTVDNTRVEVFRFERRLRGFPPGGPTAPRADF